MSRFSPAAAVLALAACTPALNWRETAVGATGLHASFPCKPDRAEHRTEFAPGRPVVLHAMGCEAGGASFAVVYGDFGSPGELAHALAQWKKAALARATVEGERPFVPPGALELPQSVEVRSRSQRADGSALQGRAAYFARGTHAFQAVVYAPAIGPGQADPFFAGLRFR